MRPPQGHLRHKRVYRRTIVHSNNAFRLSTAADSIFAMATTTMPTRSAPLKHWSGWLPITIPVFLLVLAFRYVALHGLVREADEGTEAHLFQLLMPVQLALMGYFGLTWVPRAPRGALPVLALQVLAAAAVFAAVYWIEHAGLAGA